jgi:hypothetical protein
LPRRRTMYIQKWALGELDPAKGLKVTIEEA